MTTDAKNDEGAGGLPRVFFISEIDESGDDFSSIVNTIEDRFGVRGLLLQLPIGSTATSCRGYIDLIEMTAKVRNIDANSQQYETADIPDHLAPLAQEYREVMLTAVAESDPILLEKHLGGEELTVAQILDGIRRLTAGGEICPILCEAWRCQQLAASNATAALGYKHLEIDR